MDWWAWHVRLRIFLNHIVQWVLPWIVFFCIGQGKSTLIFSRNTFVGKKTVCHERYSFRACNVIWRKDSSHISSFGCCLDKWSFTSECLSCVVLWQFSSAVWNINVKNTSMSDVKKSSKRFDRKMSPHLFFKLIRPTWHLPSFERVCTSHHLGGRDILAPLRLRVEQWISSLSIAERRGTYRRRFEELLGWIWTVLFVCCEVLRLLYFRCFKVNRSSWNMKRFVLHRMPAKSQNCAFDNFLIDCLKSLGCIWRTKGTTCVCEP